MGEKKTRETMDEGRWMIAVNPERIFAVLNEAIDALGDIPAEIVTDRQRAAYRMCMAAQKKILDRDARDSVE
ncbi:MAG: hypothetical protein JXM79_11050 [Sedimentisphaerales bacterium]|nr:hypothetical protein [Sedimentisphaerales bacterium]